MSYTATVAGDRAAIAAYAQAVDDGRYGDIAALFCEDGSVDLPAVGAVDGDFTRGPCGSPMTPRRPAAPAAAGNHGKAP